MRITIIAVGKIKEKYFTQAIEEYTKRLSRYCKLDIIQLQDEKTPDDASPRQEQQIKEREGERILHAIPEDAHVIALAIKGKSFDSKTQFFRNDVSPSAYAGHLARADLPEFPDHQS